MSQQRIQANLNSIQAKLTRDGGRDNHLSFTAGFLNLCAINLLTFGPACDGGIVRCFAASLASTHQMPVSRPSPHRDNQKCLQLLPNVARNVPGWNHWFTLRNVTAKKTRCRHCYPCRKMTRTTKLQQEVAGRVRSQNKGSFLKKKINIYVV